MRPLSAFEGRVDGLLFDLDDTVLTHGVLGRAAYDALWDLVDAKIPLVAVTGRPSGWGEVIARQWPIEGVVAENGAVHVTRDAVVFDASDRARLDAIVAEVAREVPHAKTTDDIHMRRTDVTWDVGEHEHLDDASIAKIVAIAHAAGARTTRSSVHLHATFARDDKASGAVRFLVTHLGVDAGAALHRWAFAGDSGNDAACFAAFSLTFAVANVMPWVASLSVPPRFVAPSMRGEGFAEIAKAIRTRRL
jgi:HAD superfamily hydrolase (TIGR01484 family)